MPIYTSTDDVLARVAYRGQAIADGTPSLAQVSTWLDEAEARLDATLARAGIAMAASRYAVVRPFIADDAAGLVRMAFAATGGDGQNDDGKDLRERFDAFLASILDDPEGWGRALSGAAPPSAGASRLRSYQTDNRDGLSIAAGDFAPTFKRGDML